jgi:Protein of unknown function (DUF1573)
MKRHRMDRLAPTVAFVAGALITASLAYGFGEPKIKFKETVWDFGKVKQGETLSHEFVFANEGDATLVIQRVSTSCGCTAALVSADKIQPGKEGRIEIKFDTRGYGGQVRKLVYVDSNDPGEAHRQLEIAADIEIPPSPRIELDPYNVDTGLVVEGEEIKANLTVMNKGELELKVEFNHRNAAFLSGGKPAPVPLKIAAGKEALVEVKIPTQARTGVVREYVLIKSNDPMRATLSLYVSGYIISREQLKDLFNRYKDILR